jgi:hypothetical protein
MTVSARSFVNVPVIMVVLFEELTDVLVAELITLIAKGMPVGAFSKERKLAL